MQAGTVVVSHLLRAPPPPAEVTSRGFQGLLSLFFLPLHFLFLPFLGAIR